MHGIDDLRKGPTRYIYDQIDRLKSVEGYASEQFEFDPAGNILSGNSQAPREQASNVGAGNRLRFHGDRHFHYDERGNLIEERRGKNGAIVTRYQYNKQNQLVRVEKDAQTVDYAYDPLGRRVRKQDGFGATEFLWNGDVLLCEQRNHAQKLYLYEPGSFKPLAFVERNQVYFYHLDHLGTPQEMTDWEGRVVWSARYRVYGNVLKQDVEAVENNLRFQGQYFDAETGLHYNRFRYYDPGTGQFTQQDPVGLLGGVNNYQYAPNPTGWVDPLGLSAKPGDCPPTGGKNPKVLPKGITFEGEVYRYELPGRVGTTWDAHQWNEAANHRYTEPGQTGVYAGTSPQTAQAEIAHYGALNGRDLVSRKTKVDNVLDLTDPNVRNDLGVSLKDITSNDYSKTHELGRFAKENGYDGILAPSARDPKGSNLIVFDGIKEFE